MTVTDAVPPRVAPADPAWWLDNVEATYDWLQAVAPVFEYAPGHFTVARYADVRMISRDPEQFCSSRGVLIDDPLRSGAASMGAQSVLYMDPPDHNRYRRLVSRGFTPRAVAEMEARIRELTDEVLSPRRSGDEVELVEAIAAPLPMFVIRELLGMDAIEPEQFRRWSDETIKAADGLRADMSIVGEFVAYMQDGIERHRAAPGADIMGQLIEAEIDGQSLTNDELIVFCMSLLVAGNETTRNLISGGVVALSQHPEQQTWLATNPAGIPTAVEEMLRWVTPVKAFARTATRATEVGGVGLLEGDYVVMLYAAANRDTDAFGPTAKEFDVRRAVDTAHVAFGFGEHLCLGASLARLEAQIMFEELLRRFGGVTVIGEVGRLSSCLMNGIADLPVRLAPPPR